MTPAPWSLDMVEAAELIRRKQLKPSELADSVLDRWRAVEPLIHAFVSVDEDHVRRDAKAQDGRSGGQLYGVRVAIKEIFDVAGWTTGGGGRRRINAQPAPNGSAATASLRRGTALAAGKTARQV